MGQVYDIIARASSPLTLAVAKVYMKIDPLVTEDDVLIQTLIDSCTIWGEKYTSVDFRDITYTLTLDSLEDRICLQRHKVDSIASITHLVSGSPVVIPDTTYFLRKNKFNAEVVRVPDESWPTNTDDVEQAYLITFDTTNFDPADHIIDILQRHVIKAYMNRGDCDNLEKMAKQAGVTASYDQFRLVRV